MVMEMSTVIEIPTVDSPQVPTQLVQLATLSETAALTFPRTGYVGVAAEFAEIYSEHYESAKEFFFIDALAIIGAAVSGRVKADFAVNCQPRLYVLKIGESAWSRKSTSTDISEQFVRSALAEVKGASRYLDYGSLVINGVGSAEGLARRLQADKDRDPMLGANMLARRAVLSIDEFRQFESKAKIQGSVLIPMLNTLFEKNRYENLTKDSHLLVEDGHLGFLR
jgi:hypothetical protein